MSPSHENGLSCLLNFLSSGVQFVDSSNSSSQYLLCSISHASSQVRKWTRDGFGLKGDHAHAFFPLANAEKTESNGGRIHPVWARARRAAVTGECPSLLDITVPSDSLTGSNLRIVLAKKNELRENGAADRTEDSATAIHHDHCALLALAYLAAQPEVMRAIVLCCVPENTRRWPYPCMQSFSLGNASPVFVSA